MVKYLDALVALSAVLSSDGSHCLAGVTDVVHWVIDVIVVTPSSWIANLKEKQSTKD